MKKKERNERKKERKKEKYKSVKKKERMNESYNLFLAASKEKGKESRQVVFEFVCLAMYLLNLH